MKRITLVALFAAITLTSSMLANVKIYNQTPYTIKAIVRWDGGSQTFNSIQPQNNHTKRRHDATLLVTAFFPALG